MKRFSSAGSSRGHPARAGVARWATMRASHAVLVLAGGARPPRTAAAPPRPAAARRPRSGGTPGSRPPRRAACRPVRSCLVRSGSATSTVRNISGAKNGSPVNCSASPSVSVSPSCSTPWLGMPMMSPAIGLVEQLAALRQEGHHGVRAAAPCRCARRFEPHAALEVARAHAHEGDAVAVRRVHVGLDLEHHAGELALASGCTARWSAGAGRGGGARSTSASSTSLHAEIVDGRAEEHRRLVAGEELRRGRRPARASRTSSISLARLLRTPSPKRSA